MRLYRFDPRTSKKLTSHGHDRFSMRCRHRDNFIVPVYKDLIEIIDVTQDEVKVSILSGAPEIFSALSVEDRLERGVLPALDDLCRARVGGAVAGVQKPGSNPRAAKLALLPQL